MSTWSVLGPVLGFALSAVVLFVLYWTIRLAVRHGIEDARRRHESPAEESAPGFWDPARSR
jgi:hypothetical protein